MLSEHEWVYGTIEETTKPEETTPSVAFPAKIGMHILALLRISHMLRERNCMTDFEEHLVNRVEAIVCNDVSESGIIKALVSLSYDYILNELKPTSPFYYILLSLLEILGEELSDSITNKEAEEILAWVMETDETLLEADFIIREKQHTKESVAFEKAEPIHLGWFGYPPIIAQETENLKEY